MSTQSRLVLIALTFGAASPLRAQWAVVDAPATVQLVKEVQTASQQLATLQSQLQQAEQTLQSMSGARGMQLLLGGLNRNYLPSNWGQLAGAGVGAGGPYGGLTGTIQGLIAANARLSSAQMSALSPANQQQIGAARQWTATQQAVSQSALANASDRFASLQMLVNAISTAVDQKGILELQARIAAELAMVQNEQIKLQVMTQSIQAQQASTEQQQRELDIAAHGQFATRFQPVP
jgi:type IV secretion system protein VirB5